MRKFDLVIFDFDGTLADSTAWFRTRVNDVARRFKLREVSDAEYEQLRNKSTSEIIREMQIPRWKIPFIARYMRKLAAREIDNISLFAGARELLADLHDNGVQLAMVSSNNEANVRQILGPEDAAKFSRYAMGASLHGKGAKLKSVLKALKADPARTLFIGDEERDVLAAHRAGIAAGSATWGYATADLLEQAKPDYLFTEMADIRKVVLGEGA